MSAPCILLPGVLASAAVRFAPLVAALGADSAALPKELDVYAGETPPPGYGIQTEVDGIDRFATDRGLTAFHLYGYSIGASIALAYAAQHSDRVLSLALDEPASDFSELDRELLAEAFPVSLAELPPAERMGAFVRAQLRPGTPPPPGPAPAPGPEAERRGERAARR